MNISSAEEPTKIERYNYPSLRHYCTIRQYRHDNSYFEKSNEMNTNIQLQNDYTKWKKGISYVTNRKISIEGKKHKELKQKFMLGVVLFEDLLKINAYDYIQETNKIRKQEDINNAIEDAKIKEHNLLIYDVIEKIKKLESWYEFVEFKGIKYGMSTKVINSIHRENDCYGEMVFYKLKQVEHECSGCRSGFGCGARGCECYWVDTKVDKCSKCGFIS